MLTAFMQYFVSLMYPLICFSSFYDLLVQVIQDYNRRQTDKIMTALRLKRTLPCGQVVSLFCWGLKGGGFETHSAQRQDTCLGCNITLPPSGLYYKFQYQCFCIFTKNHCIYVDERSALSVVYSLFTWSSGWSCWKIYHVKRWCTHH